MTKLTVFRMRNWLLLFSLILASTGQAQEEKSALDARERAKAAAEAAQERTRPEVSSEKPEYQDKERVRRLANEGRRRGEAFFQERFAATDETAGDSEDNDPQVDGRLVVALSSSMPEDMLRQYFLQLDGHKEAIVVLRGFIGGAKTVQPTGQWLEKIRRKQADCLECGHYMVETVVDPLLYRDLNITRVPALAYLPGVKDLKHCDAETYAAASVIYGATSVKSALEAMTKEGVKVPEALLDRFDSRGWESQS